MAGRRPKPTALKELAGNPGKRPLNDAEPRPEIGEPERPKGLDKPARRAWRIIVPKLLAMGVLTKADGQALASYCDCVMLIERSRRDIKTFGIFTTNALTGERKKSPAVQILLEATAKKKSIEVEFGLTPASRSKLKMTANGDAQEDEADAFFTNGPKLVTSPPVPRTTPEAPPRESEDGEDDE